MKAQGRDRVCSCALAAFAHMWGLPSGGGQRDDSAWMHTRRSRLRFSALNLFPLHKPGENAAETPDGMPTLGQTMSVGWFTVPLVTHLTAWLRRFIADIGRCLAARDCKTCSTLASVPSHTISMCRHEYKKKPWWCVASHKF